MFHKNSFHRRGSVEHRLREIGEELSDIAREKLEALREGASEYYELGRKKTREWSHEARAYLEEQPVKAIAIACGAGLAIGLLLKYLLPSGERGGRRRDD